MSRVTMTWPTNSDNSTEFYCSLQTSEKYSAMRWNSLFQAACAVITHLMTPDQAAWAGWP